MVPVLVCLAALIFIAHALTLEDRKMIGDEDGHDPGSRAMPLASGGLMFAAGAYELLRSRKKRVILPEAGTGVGTGNGSGKLFVLTLGGGVLYILLIEPVGFLVLTTIFLYILFSVYGRASPGDGKPRYSDELLGLAAAVIGVTVLYSAGRFLSRELFYLGRSMGSEFLASRTMAVASFTLIAGLLYGAAVKIAAPHLRGKDRYKIAVRSVSLSTATTLFLFVVFRMTFRVNFPAGLLFW